MKILITSVGTATSVNLIKYFHKDGDRVVGTDINYYGFTAGSMLSDVFYQVSPAQNNDYINEITDIINKEKTDLFIPVNDTEIYITAKNIEKIKCRCIIPDIKTIELLRDKFICSTYMKKSGLSVPDFLGNNDDGERIIRKRISVGSKGISFVGAHEKCPDYDPDIYFLQRKVSGEEYTVDVLCTPDGKPVYIVPRKRIEVKSGVATKVEIVNDLQLIDNVKRILSSVRLPGFSNIQFIKDNTGNCWFIEVNCRFSGAGAATLLVADGYLQKFRKSLTCNCDFVLNENVIWNSIVTRYYEEVVYEKGIC